MIEIELKDGPFAGNVYRLPSLAHHFTLEHWSHGKLHLVTYLWTGVILEDARRVFEYEGTR